MNLIIKGELQDDRILSSLNMSIREFKAGEIIDCRDRLLEIVAALDEFLECCPEIEHNKLYYKHW